MAALGPGLCLFAHVVVWLAAVAWAQDGVGGIGGIGAPREVEIVKQINRMNEDGSYTFGYEAADGSFKIETRDVTGAVKGMFGFIDETGELKRVSYTANNGTGFKASGDVTVPTVAYTTVPPGYTTVAASDDQEPTRRPLLVLREPADSTSRAPVIQHIPRRYGSSTTTTPAYGDYLKGRRTHIVLPKVTEEPEVDEPTRVPLKKLVVTKRPVSKEGNNLRRQLGNEPESGGDVADVYSGGGGSPRFVPVQSVRSPQSNLLANLPPHVAAAIRQQQIARAAASLRPGPAVLDEQEYPVTPTRPPVRAIYRPVQEPPRGAPPSGFPMASLRSLRDELMDYILQYIQYRLSGGAPYMGNPFTPFNNPGLGYQNPLGYPGVNPYNPYLYPGPPYPRAPYQPFPGGYPPVGYPGGYPGQGFPQPLPFSSPNKQQAAQQYGGQAEQSRGPTAQQYQEVDSRGSSGAASYTLPPNEVLRLMLARGLATSTAAPVRSVQILGAASDISASTVRPPPAPLDQMEMQA